MKNYQEAKASHDILENIMSIPPSPIIHNPTPVKQIDHISLKDVSFEYDWHTPTLDHISLEIQKWETIAFVWPSGSGKSTLLKLLVGLYTPRNGDILYNHHSLTSYDLQSLNQYIGIVTQDAQLFSGSIKDNLIFVSPKATDEECLKVLQQAQLMEFIDAQPDGLSTKIGEWGLKLSGGQKQRLAIARALLRNPHVLLFDEATSSLDSIIEKEITETIKNITAQNHEMITILVAHRLSTVMHADRIYVLERWSIIESGNHTTLLAQQWLYYALWREQIGQNT